MKSVPDKRKTQLTFLLLSVLFFITKDPFYWVADVGFALGGVKLELLILKENHHQTRKRVEGCTDGTARRVDDV